MCHQQITRAFAAALIAIGGLSPTTGALAQPAHDIGTSTSEHATPIARNHSRCNPTPAVTKELERLGAILQRRTAGD